MFVHRALVFRRVEVNQGAAFWGQQSAAIGRSDGPHHAHQPAAIPSGQRHGAPGVSPVPAGAGNDAVHQSQKALPRALPLGCQTSVPAGQTFLAGDQRLRAVAEKFHAAALSEHREWPVRGRSSAALAPFQLMQVAGQVDGPAHMGHQLIEPGGILCLVGALPAGALHQQLDGVVIGLVHGAADTVVDIQAAGPVVIELGLVETALPAGKIQVGGVQAPGGLFLQFRAPGAGVDEIIHVVLVGPGIRKSARTFHKTPNVSLSPTVNYVTKQGAPVTPARQRNDWTTDRKMPTPPITLPPRVETPS